jgi:anti-sigma factor RsiW
MNCSRTRVCLGEFVHGGLTPANRKQLEVHLQSCAACRAECTALQQVGRLLDRLPAPETQVDLARLYRDAAEAQQRRMRRWRRVAVTLGIAAAGALLLALGLRCEVHLEAHQLVVRWGTPTPAAAPPLPRAPVIEERLAGGISPEVEERLRMLGELVETLAAEGEARDRRQREELVRLKVRLHELHQEAATWHAIVDRDVSALYGVQFPPKRKGEHLP